MEIRRCLRNALRWADARLDRDEWARYSTRGDELTYIPAPGGIWSSRRFRKFTNTGAFTQAVKRLSQLSGDSRADVTARLSLAVEPISVGRDMLNVISEAVDAQRRELYIHVAPIATIHGGMTIHFGTAEEMPRCLVGFGELPQAEFRERVFAIIDECTRPMNRREVRRHEPVVDNIDSDTAKHHEHESSLRRKDRRAAIWAGVLSGAISGIGTALIALWLGS